MSDRLTRLFLWAFPRFMLAEEGFRRHIALAAEKDAEIHWLRESLLIIQANVAHGPDAPKREAFTHHMATRALEGPGSDDV